MNGALIIAILGLIAIAIILVKAICRAFNRSIDALISERFAQHQQYTTLICKRQIERTHTHLPNGDHLYIEREYEHAHDGNLIELQTPRRLPHPLGDFR